MIYVRLETAKFGCYLAVACDKNGDDIYTGNVREDYLFQTDHEYPYLAKSYGWNGELDNILGAIDYLDEHEGDVIEDPGYFPELEESDNGLSK